VFIEVSQDEYQRLLDAVRARKPFEQLEEQVRGMRRESVGARLERAKSMLEDISTKLGKTPPRVEIRHDDLRLPPGPWAPFWSILAHVLNNAVDHGLESDDERRRSGKSVPAKFVLSAQVREGEVVIDVRDDGRGIDWERVRELAATRGLPHQSERELTQALFSDGFSLKDQVSETSGRGVGLAAVKNVVTAMGGRIELESTQKVGTTWRFLFSLAALGDTGSEEER
jgi:two-component system chemotaxis sensor kinase CheA